MFEDHLRYDRLIDDAMRNVVKEVLTKVSKEGLTGNHHFLLSFVTSYPGAVVPLRLLSRYPQEMTIVLQHQYEELEVHDEYFSVLLSFDGIKEKIIIPFESLSSFADPGVRFGLKFNLVSGEEESAPAQGGSAKFTNPHEGAPAPAPAPGVAESEGGKGEESANSNVVSLDFFRDK